MTFAYSKGANSVSVYAEGEYHSIQKTDPNYDAVVQELAKPAGERDEQKILDLLNVPRAVEKVAVGRIKVTDSQILFRDEEIGGYMVDKLLAMHGKGENLDPWVRFMDNLMDNPNAEVREDLYKWMEKGQLPLTEDGMIIAFKKVNSDFTDVHTGKFDNTPGQELEMPREKCDPNRDRTCSTGFHFCSADYLYMFGGSKVVVVNINPRDVTAIPTDYNLTKARCCKYRVVAELKSQDKARDKVWKEKNVINFEDPRELPDILIPRKGKASAKKASAAKPARARSKGPAKSPKQVTPDPKRTSGPAPRDPLAGGSPQPEEIVDVPVSPPKKKPSGAKKPPAKKAAKTVRDTVKEAAKAVKDAVVGKPKKAPARKPAKSKVTPATKAPSKAASKKPAAAKAKAPARKPAAKSTKAPAKRRK